MICFVCNNFVTCDSQSICSCFHSSTCFLFSSCHHQQQINSHPNYHHRQLLLLAGIFIFFFVLFTRTVPLLFYPLCFVIVFLAAPQLLPLWPRCKNPSGMAYCSSFLLSFFLFICHLPLLSGKTTTCI